MGAFEIIDVCDKLSDAISRLGDALIVIDVNFFLLTEQPTNETRSTTNQGTKNSS